MMAFMGSAFAGASASSHAFFSLRTSVADLVSDETVGGAGDLEEVLEEGGARWEGGS